MAINISRRKNLFISFFSSYIFILLIPIIIGSISYWYSNKIIRKQMESYNMAILQQAQNSIDEHLYGISKLEIDINLNARINTFLYTNKNFNHKDYYDMSYVINELNNYKRNNDFIDKIYIYFKNSEIILTNTGKYEPSFYYNAVTTYKDWDYNQWMNILMDNHYHHFTPAQQTSSPYVTSTDNVEMLTYFQSLPLGRINSNSGTLVILISREKFDKILNNINILNSGEVYILNSQDEVIMYIGDKSLMSPLGYSELTSGENFYDKMNNQKVFVSSISSEYSDWKFVSVLPVRVFANQANYVKVLTCVIILAELVIGSLLALILARKKYIPLKRTIDNLNNIYINNIRICISGNEINFIEQATSATLRENEKMHKSIKDAQYIIQANLLTQLLKGPFNYKSEDENSLNSFGITFCEEYYCVLIVHIEDCSKFVKDGTFLEQSLVKMLIINIMEEYVNYSYKAYMVDLDQKNIAMIVNLRMNNNLTKKHITDISYFVMEFIHSKFKIIINIGLSSIHEGLKSVKVSYQEASKALEYKIVLGKTNVICFDDLDRFNNHFTYPLEMEMLLLNSAKVGDFDKIQQLLQDFFKQNFSDSIPSLEITQCLFFSMISTVMRVINNLDIDHNDILNNDLQPLNKLILSNNMEDMYTTLIITYKKICNYVSLNKKSHNIGRIEQIIQYLNNNYKNENICLTSVSSDIGINPTYLSFFFKEQTGENFVNYVNKLRLANAKELLIQTSYPLYEIAQLVGYSNSNVLIRIYKKYEGITPGQFREANQHVVIEQERSG